MVERFFFAELTHRFHLLDLAMVARQQLQAPPATSIDATVAGPQKAASSIAGHQHDDRAPNALNLPCSGFHPKLVIRLEQTVARVGDELAEIPA